MNATAPLAPTALVTVLSWGTKTTPPQRARALASAVGLGVGPATELSRLEPPLIVDATDDLVRDEIVRALAEQGIAASAPTLADLEATPKPLGAKRLVAPEGPPESMYLVELWRGESFGLLMNDVRLITFCECRNKTTAIESGLGEMSVQVGNTWQSPRETTRTTMQYVFLIELFLRDGRRVRIDSRKFNFDVLGPERGLVDRVSASTLHRRLCEETPHARHDDGLLLRQVLPHVEDAYRRLATQHGYRVGTETTAFEFYSALLHSAHRLVRHGGAMKPGMKPARPSPQ